ARLFARPANLLILDEPTNDLDLETLELLESGLRADNPKALMRIAKRYRNRPGHCRQLAKPLQR
ncbi:MAG: hypothetical protein EBY14_10715, partial [Betaproteobacteria bacterium]|nr:hypothetical protein [Betaproteobacteria bacterium]NDB40944.1 hypothetical protein [Betaproteobacteria bacterium]